MNKRTADFLQKTFLFHSVREESFAKILNEISPEIKSFKAKEIIYSPDDFEAKIGFVQHGSCLVERLCGGASVPLNTICDGASFGIMAVLSDEDEFPTQIIAKKATTVIFISKNDLLSVIKKYPSVAMNVISFLTKKISFLNKKIAAFSPDTAEKKLATMLFLEYKERGVTEFPINCKKVAEALNTARATVYRALSALSEEQIIEFENKIVRIIDLDSLERKTK